MTIVAEGPPAMDYGGSGIAMYELVEELYPLCRSISGNGVRDTLRYISGHIPLEVHEVATGTPVFDWIVPREWNIRDAFVKNSRGERVIDFNESNLHVMSYSVPVHRTVTLEELRRHLYSLPEHPDWIPYKTSYYEENWGFCVSQNLLDRLEPGEYEVSIDATLEPGHLTYGECYLPGARANEILISCHVCHPSLCNDNLSGIALSTYLARHLAQRELNYSYRFLFIPGTIGAIVWLALNEASTARISHGLVVANVGDAGKMHYKKSRRASAEIDSAVIHVLKHSGAPFEVMEFSPYGYDERQYGSPGFDLAVGVLTRTPHGQYPQYHTSADDLTLVRPECLADSFKTYVSVLDVLECNRRYLNLNPKCEPQLGKRGLYRGLGGGTSLAEAELAMLWVLNLSDGECSLLDIAERSGLAFSTIHASAKALLSAGLLEENVTGTRARANSHTASRRGP